MTISNIGSAINAAHARVEASRRIAVEAAAECGRLLAQAKATVPHGGWGDWLRTNCAFSARTAQLYMQLADYLGDGDPAKAQRVADLSLREVARFLVKESGRSRKTPVSPEVASEAAEIHAAWDAASPAARETAFRRMFKQGDITREQRDQMIVAAMRDPAAEGEVAAEGVASFLAKSLPREALMKLAALQKRSKLTGAEIAIALGDIMEERGGRN